MVTADADVFTGLADDFGLKKLAMALGVAPGLFAAVFFPGLGLFTAVLSKAVALAPGDGASAAIVMTTSSVVVLLGGNATAFASAFFSPAGADTFFCLALKNDMMFPEEAVLAFFFGGSAVAAAAAVDGGSFMAVRVNRKGMQLQWHTIYQKLHSKQSNYCDSSSAVK